MISGIYLCYALLFRNKGGILEVFIPEYSLFFGLSYLGISLLIAKLRYGSNKSLYNGIAPVIGIAILIVCLLPMTSVPYLLNESERSYTQAFGEYSKGNIAEGDKQYFMDMPFSIPGYFFGIPARNYNVVENVLFYEGTQGVDDGLKLYFDAYTPAQDDAGLPGKGSVLIRIHGGGWTIRNKGRENMAQVNKYFAGQGYVVFDIQYGLWNGKKFVDFMEVPENITGDFSIDDMVRHIGIFTKYPLQLLLQSAADNTMIYLTPG